MPVGVIINALSVVFGGIAGTFAGKNYHQNLKRILKLFSEFVPWEWV